MRGSRKQGPRNKRAIPCYLCFASDFMAEELYVDARLTERGLLFAIMNYCWVNGSIPADGSRMAKLLSIDPTEVTTAWGKLIERHVTPMPSDPTRLWCLELQRQRAEREAYVEKLSRAGAKGGLQTQKKNRESLLSAASDKALGVASSEASGDASSLPSSPNSGLAKAAEMRREDEKRGGVSLTRDSGLNNIPTSSVNRAISRGDLEDTVDAYRRASNGE